MDKSTLRKVQLSQLEISKEIKRVCEENGIKYFLDSGTLLGAVRHKGFIPWDDDMDFGMLREEYDKFIQIAPEKLDNRYFLQTWTSDPYYPYAFAKVRKLGTVYQETAMKNSRAHNELYVDIFPYDNYPDDIKKRNWQRRKIMLYRFAIMMKRKAAPWLNHRNLIERFLVRCKYLPATLFAYMHDDKEMIRRMEEVMICFNNVHSEHYYAQAASSYGKWVISSECFDHLTQLLFEDSFFSVPVGYKKYLEEAYGDYMRLPPVDKRENKHQILEVKL